MSKIPIVEYTEEYRNKNWKKCKYMKDLRDCGEWVLRFANCVASRSNGTSLIDLKGVGESPSSGAIRSVAFTQRRKAQGNSGSKPARVTSEKYPYKPSYKKFWIHFRTIEGENGQLIYKVGYFSKKVNGKWVIFCRKDNKPCSAQWLGEKDE